MASVFIQLEGQVGSSATTLYTAFTGTPTKAVLAYLTITNTSTSDVTVDVWFEQSGGTARRFADDLTVPAKGSITWKGLITLDASGEKIRAQASVNNVLDYLGTVTEVD